MGAPACGDVMKLQIMVENGVVKDAKFKTFGCGSAIASRYACARRFSALCNGQQRAQCIGSEAARPSLPPALITQHLFRAPPPLHSLLQLGCE